MDAINEMRKLLLKMSLGDIIIFNRKKWIVDRSYDGAIRQMANFLDEIEEKLKNQQ